MCLKEGMGIAPWGVIGQGKWMSQAQIDERVSKGDRFRGGAGELSEKDLKMSHALEDIAKEIGDGATVTSVAIAWALLKYPYVFPISVCTPRLVVTNEVLTNHVFALTVGGRKINHLHDNINALKHDLTSEQMAALEDIYPFDFGFPFNTFGQDSRITGKTENMLINASAHLQWVKAEQAIRPVKE